MSAFFLREAGEPFHQSTTSMDVLNSMYFFVAKKYHVTDSG
jgi:hypothetical protein